jgi:hypothetical protein
MMQIMHSYLYENLLKINDLMRADKLLRFRIINVLEAQQ